MLQVRVFLEFLIIIIMKKYFMFLCKLLIPL